MNVAILCRTLGRQCGISEYAKTLAERLGAVTCSSPTEALGLGATVAIIQYEPSLYNDVDDLLNEVDQLRTIIPIIDMHSQQPATVSMLTHHLRGRPGFVGVKVATDGAWLLPHISYPDPGGAVLPPDGLKLGGFGFALPHKRYENIIALGRRLQIPVLILAAVANATSTIEQQSQRYLDGLQEMAGDGIEIDRSFLTREEIVTRLRSCSHLINAMVNTGSTSGSLHLMALVGRPILSLPSLAAEEVRANLVSSLSDITLAKLQIDLPLPVVADSLGHYTDLLAHIEHILQLQGTILHHDRIYLDDPRQMKRMDWLKERVKGRAIDVGIGNGWSTEYLGAVAGAEIRDDRAEYAALRFPHIEFRIMDASKEVWLGFDTVILAEIIEHMSWDDADAMVRMWAETKPERILITTPNGDNPAAQDLVKNVEHVWRPTVYQVMELLPDGYRIAEMEENDFINAVFQRA